MQFLQQITYFSIYDYIYNIIKKGDFIMKNILLIPLLAVTLFLFNDTASASNTLGEELTTLSSSEVAKNS